jgi:N-acetyl-gamma-glutamyl-phosphate reductase
MINVAIVGATGYVGAELVRLLHNNSEYRISTVVSQSFIGQKYSDVYPSLKGIFDMECESLDIEKIAVCSDIIINALPHGISKTIIPGLLKKGKKVIDHSGDFRYKSVEVYEKWYKIKHEMPYLLESAVYGLPELYRDKIKDAQLVSNPGCYPTSAILGLAPLLKNKLISTQNIIVDAASGMSGAGRKAELSYTFCESTENYKAYNVSTHRHTSEIEQEYSALAGQEILISFTPHLMPVKRGMLSTIYANLISDASTHQMIDLYKEFYKNDYFVRVQEEGKLPETKNTAGSNFIDIAPVVDTRLNRVVVLSSLDNLGKGAAGQAVQNLNIMCGIEENKGLKTPALYL